MAKLLILTGMGEPECSSTKGLIHAFRDLGHEVCTAGPPYWGRGDDADIPLPDRPHPELYTYEEVLSLAPWSPDLFLDIEPHAYVSGKKPPALVSAFLATDAHRAGELYERMLREGQYAFFFNGQHNYLPFFSPLPLKQAWLPPAFDMRRFDHTLNADPSVDIAFVGQTGIANMEYPHRDENGCYATGPPRTLSTDYRRFAFHGHMGFDYAARADLLINLCRDFRVRLYADVWEPLKFQRALQTGRIGFNCSLIQDLSIRCFEVMAAHRFLVTDDVGVGDWLPPHATYRTLYNPLFANFRLAYQEVKRIIRSLLERTDRERVAQEAYEQTWKRHTWHYRARQLLEIALN